MLFAYNSVTYLDYFFRMNNIFLARLLGEYVIIHPVVGQTCLYLPGSRVNCGPYWPGSRVNSGLIGPAAGWIAFAFNYDCGCPSHLHYVSTKCTMIVAVLAIFICFNYMYYDCGCPSHLHYVSTKCIMIVAVLAIFIMFQLYVLWLWLS